jgi:hypothetical protein
MLHGAGRRRRPRLRAAPAAIAFAARALHWPRPRRAAHQTWRPATPPAFLVNAPSRPTQFTPLYAGTLPVVNGSKPLVGGGLVEPLGLNTLTPGPVAAQTAEVSLRSPFVVPLAVMAGISSSFLSLAARPETERRAELSGTESLQYWDLVRRGGGGRGGTEACSAQRGEASGRPLRRPGPAGHGPSLHTAKAGRGVTPPPALPTRPVPTLMASPHVPAGPAAPQVKFQQSVGCSVLEGPAS